MSAAGTRRTIQAFLAIEGIAFLIVASIHAGVLPVGSRHAAAIPEGIIAAVLIGALALTWPLADRMRAVAIAAQAFALALTVIGTYVTIIGIGPDNPWDLPFHFVILVVLTSGIAVAARRPDTSAPLTAMSVVQWLIRASGLLQIALGLAFWLGALLVAIPFHIFNGVLFVLLVESQAAIAAWAGASMRWIAITAAWGLVVVVVGLTQTQLLPGEWHWLVRAAHLGIGLVAIALAERLARAAKSRIERETRAPVTRAAV
jgi:hypothetical protein